MLPVDPNRCIGGASDPDREFERPLTPDAWSGALVKRLSFVPPPLEDVSSASPR